MRNVATPFLCAAAMGIAVWLVDYWLPRGLNAQLLRLAIGVPTGALVYALLIRFYWAQGWENIRDLHRV